jgi:hypothetical protein
MHLWLMLCAECWRAVALPMFEGRHAVWIRVEIARGRWQMTVPPPYVLHLKSLHPAHCTLPYLLSLHSLPC